MKDILAVIKSRIPTDSTSTRLYHGRGKQFPGHEFWVLDYFDPTLLITLYAQAPENFLTELMIELSLLPLKAENILLQKRYLPKAPFEVLKGQLINNSFARESEDLFHLKFGQSQNIGFFLDMAPGRALLRDLAKDKLVLNLFSYTCSLSVAALKGGAQQVVNVDMSKAALALGEENHRLNNLELRRARFLSYDIMNSWKNIAKYGPYDLVVIDPPTNQGESFKVERDYYKIVKRLKSMCSPQAVIIACLNSPHLDSEFLIELFEQHAPEYKYQKTHYSAFAQMELRPQEGLKILIFQASTQAN